MTEEKKKERSVEIKKKCGQIRRLIADVEQLICDKPGPGLTEDDEKFVKALKQAGIKVDKAHIEYTK
jgi:hypothetical protein